MRTRISHGGFSGAGCSISPRTGAPACSRLRTNQTPKAGCKPALRPMCSPVQCVKGFGEFSPLSFTHRRHFSHGLEDCAATVRAVSTRISANSSKALTSASIFQASSRTAAASAPAIATSSRRSKTSVSIVEATASVPASTAPIVQTSSPKAAQTAKPSMTVQMGGKFHAKAQKRKDSGISTHSFSLRLGGLA